MIYFDLNAGEQCLFDVVLTSSGGTLLPGDLLDVRFELRLREEVNPPTILKTLNAGVSIVGPSGTGVACLVSLSEADTELLGAGNTYQFTVVGVTATQRNVADKGYISVNHPTIT